MFDEKTKTLKLLDLDINEKKIESIIHNISYEKIESVKIKYFESRSNYYYGETKNMILYSFQDLISTLYKIRNL